MKKVDAVRRPAVKLLAVVWLLDADAEKISTWIGDACAVLRPREPAKCGIAIARMLLKQNGAQFPVAGHVLETQREAGCEDCEQDLLIYLPFRDGVTVTMKSDMQSRRNTTYIDGAAALEGAETTLGPLRSVQRYGRIANLDGKSIGSLDENWLFANRKAYLDALRSDSYSFLRVSAAAYCKENPVRCGISSPQ